MEERRSEEPEREEGKGERANEERKMPDEGIDEPRMGRTKGTHKWIDGVGGGTEGWDRIDGME